eukprot:COSAG01_NODE_52017_length_350_cov_0.501992_1_plen_95_part_01
MADPKMPHADTDSLGSKKNSTTKANSSADVMAAVCPADMAAEPKGTAAPTLYEVEAVVGERGRGQQRELRVRWAGWRGRPDEHTWELAARMQQQV